MLFSTVETLTNWRSSIQNFLPPSLPLVSSVLYLSPTHSLSSAGLNFCHLHWVWLFLTQSFWILNPLAMVDIFWVLLLAVWVAFGALKAECYIYIICKPLAVPLLLVLSNILIASRNSSKWQLCLWMMICWGFELIIVYWILSLRWLACWMHSHRVHWCDGWQSWGSALGWKIFCHHA